MRRWRIWALGLVCLALCSSPAGAAVNGLRGDYFNSLGFTNRVSTQTNPTIDFTWGASPPVSGLGANYTVRWTGQVVPLFTETYTFSVTAATGARLWVNDQMLAARTVSLGGTDTITGTITLTAGQSYNLALEYICSTNASRVRLAWSSPSQSLQTIPASQLLAAPLATSDAGAIQEEYWLNLAGTNLSTLAGCSNFPAMPAGRELLLTFESLAPNWTTNLGTRVSGWLLPRTNGYYQFAVSAADTAQLALSTDATTNNKVVVATVPAAVGFEQFSNFATQVSAPIALVGGQSYYIELLQKASTNASHFSVAWLPPGATGFTVIAGDYLAPSGLHVPQPGASSLFNTLATAHPRLMTSPERFTWLKQCIASNSPAYVVNAWRSISNSASGLLSSPLQSYNSGAMAGPGQGIQSVVEQCGMVYFVTGNTNFAERAWLELSNACTFPAWWASSNDGLGQGEMGLGMGLGYDWFYDYLTPARRSYLTNGMLTLGVQPSQGQYPGAWYVKSTANNWAMVFNSGSVALAVALANDSPTASQNLLNSALNSMRPVLGHFTTDNGGYFEGSEYWDYGVTHLVHLLAGVESSLGTLFSLDDTPGLDDTALYELYNTGPTYQGFDYSDSYTGNIAGGGLTWLSRRFNRPVAAWWKRSRTSTGGVGEVLWYDGRGSSPGQGGMAPDTYFRGPAATTSPVFAPCNVGTLRSEWDDANASFAGFKAGLVADSHGHLDAGSFVFDALNHRWIVDLGTGNYSYPMYFDSVQGWYFYRKRAEGHNTLVIGPDGNPDQVLNAQASMLYYQASPAGDQSAVIADLTPAYAFSDKAAPTRVWRGQRLFNNRSWLLVQDEIQAATPLNVWWFAHFANGSTSAQVSADGSAVTLTSGNNRLWVKRLTGGGNFAISNAVAFPTTPAPTGGQDDNSGFSKIALNLPAVTNATIAVLMVPLLPGDSAPLTLPPVVALQSWATNGLGVGPNVPPVASAANLTLTNTGVATLDLASLVTDTQTADAQLRFALSQVSTGSVALLPDGHTLQYQPPSNYVGAASLNYTVTDRGMDPRLLFYFNFQAPNWTNPAEPADLSGHWHDGTFDTANSGVYSNTPLAPGALGPFITQSARLVNIGTSGARLSRGLSTAEYNLSSNAWTFSGWFRRESRSSLDCVFYVGNGNGLSGTGDELELFLQANSNDLTCQHWNAASTSDFSFTVPNPCSVGTWHHVALSFSGATNGTGQVRLYLDGVLVGGPVSVSWNLHQEAPLRFGAHADATTAQDRWFDGELAEIALFRGALSSAEITALAGETVAHFGGLSATNTVAFNVLSPAPPTPPVLASIANQVVYANNLLSVTNAASDTNSPPQRLLFSLLNAPAGASINATNGVITWTPGTNLIGSSNWFTVVVTQAGVQTNLAAVADAYVRDGSSYSNVNYGADTNLYVKLGSSAGAGLSRESYLKFSLAGFNGGLASAQLQLRARSVSLPGMQAVAVAANDTWSESALTWSNRPGSSLPALATWTPAAGAVAQVDVTSAAAAALAADKLLSLRVYATNVTADGLVDYGSREGDLAYAPSLSVILTNNLAQSATQSFWAVVLAPVVPPVLTVPSNPVVLGGAAVALTNTASDPNTPPQRVLFSLLAAPPGASLDTNSGVISWRPSVAQSGSSNLFTVVATQAGWQTNLAALADAYVRDGSSYSNLNFGTDTNLYVKLGATANTGLTRESYLRFMVPAAFTNITDARLQLTPRSVSLPGVHAVASVTDDTWNETALTWRNRPPSGPVLSTWQPVAGQVAEALVTAAAQQAQAGDGLLSLRVYATNTTADGLVSYVSREGDPAGAPHLVLASVPALPLSTTQSFWVTVTAPAQPVLQSVDLSQGRFSFQVTGSPGPDYTIQSTTNLAAPGNWLTLFTTNAPPTPFLWSDPDTNAWAQRFYRVLLGP